MLEREKRIKEKIKRGNFILLDLIFYSILSIVFI